MIDMYFFLQYEGEGSLDEVRVPHFGFAYATADIAEALSFAPSKFWSVAFPRPMLERAAEWVNPYPSLPHYEIPGEDAAYDSFLAHMNDKDSVMVSMLYEAVAYGAVKRLFAA